MRRNMWTLLCLFGCMLGYGFADLPPKFVNDMDGFNIEENRKTGSLVYTLSATDPEGRQVKYYMDTGTFEVNEYSGEVTLVRRLDYERVNSIPVTVKISDGQNNVKRNIYVNVLDINDEIPSFNSATYFVKVTENTAVNKTIVDNIQVKDVDGVNDMITVRCEPGSQHREDCETFSVVQIGTRSTNNWQGKIILAKPLNFETKNSYQVPLVAFDGKNYKTQSVEIEVLDVADLPPYFVLAQSVAVFETNNIGVNIVTVKAKDGDRFSPRQLRYEIYNATLDYFKIDPRTGLITNKVPLDREDPRLPFNTPIPVLLKVREMITVNPDVLGNSPTTTATASINVALLDQNDNIPIFNSNYTATIPEDIVNNDVVPQLWMIVYDKDLGNNANYSFHLDTFGSVFYPFPAFGVGLSNVGLKVKNTSYIDYEKGPRVYNFKLIAKEIYTTERNSGFTYVTIYIEDINDNAPTVNKSLLIATVSEMAPSGYKVIDIDAVDNDSGNFGTDGILYVSLKGLGDQLFSLNSQTGEITLRDCNTLGKSPCLDYEVKQQYNFTVLIADNKNDPINSQKRQINLIINIEDTNDNMPVFSETEYWTKILEGTTKPQDNVLSNKVTDPDTKGTLKFSIVKQNVNGLFAINSQTGSLTATQPVTLKDIGSNNFIDVEVSVSDGVKSAKAIVHIEVLDVNNHKPTFTKSSYSVCISEQYSGGVSILKVEATDNDMPGTANSKIIYSVVQGGDGLFFIEPNGVIKTTFGARFDYETKKDYTLTIMAKDNGLPSLNRTTQVDICIDDVNDLIPYFIPFTVQVYVNETVPVNKEIIQLTASDIDTTAKLKFSFAEPSNAINPNGLNVDKNKYNYTSFFRMDPDNGKIFVAKSLDRDKVSIITHTIKVVDTAAVDQTGTGMIIINILDINKIPPRFIKPWTTSNPFYNVDLNEEQSVGSSVIALNAVDDDGSIEGYQLGQTKGYFVINKGLVTVNKRIDFEAIEKLSFLAYAWDNVPPKMTATATVFVTVKNINDNNPLFQASIYNFNTEENTSKGQIIGTVSATDIDKGTYGSVLYTIESNAGIFDINTITGEMMVLNSTALDRETVEEIRVTVTAFDSPNDASVRRSSVVPVYITLTDKNDNAPVFSQSYFATIEEDAPFGLSILKVSANDNDIGVNAIVRYIKSTGEPQGLFSVSSDGVISVSRSLLNKTGRYNFLVTAISDGKSSSHRNQNVFLSSQVNVTINVVKGISAAPLWIAPATDNEVLNVLESQYKGMFVYRARAVSSDLGPNGRIKYMFLRETFYSQTTKEFYINPITGVISAFRIFDREEKDTYTLDLIAEDSNTIPQKSERRLIIKILDVNDNKPAFSVSKGLVIPYTFQVYEDVKPPFYIGSILAKDRDENAKVYYNILSGNSDNMFSLNLDTGALYLQKPVDRENTSSFSLNIEATDSRINYDLLTPNHIRRLERKWADLSIAHVDINIADVNDEIPKFTQSEYYGCISTADGIMKTIVTVKAIDADINSNSLEYTIANVQKQGGSAIKEKILSIGKKTGIIQNQELMSKYKDDVFLIDIVANDTTAKGATDTAKGLVFVTEKKQAVKLVLTQPSTDVHYFVPQIKKLLSQKSDNSYICVSDIREHILPNGLVNPHWSDMFVYVIGNKDGKYKVDGADSAVAKLNSEKATDEPSFSGIYIQKIKVAESSDASKDFPVLLIAILVILLILLALLLFIIACCCIAQSKKKQIDEALYARDTKVHSETFDENAMTSIYDNKGYTPHDHNPSTFISQPTPLQSEIPVHSISSNRNSEIYEELPVRNENINEPAGTSKRSSSYEPVSLPVAKSTTQNDLPFDSTSYGRGSVAEGGRVTPYPGSNYGSGHDRHLTPYSMSVNDVNGPQGEIVEPNGNDGSGKKFAPYAEEYGSERINDLTPDPYEKSFDFNDEPESIHSSERSHTPLYSVVNKNRAPDLNDINSDIPGLSQPNEFPDPEPTIRTSLVDPIEEPKIECEIEPDIEPDSLSIQHSDFDYPPPLPIDDEPVIVTELIDNAR